MLTLRPKKSSMSRLRFRTEVMIQLSLAVFLLASCAETTLAPTFRASRGLPRPDRVLVFDFAVTPEEAGVERRSGLTAQSEEDVRVGKALARALSTNLVSELRSRGIEADRVGDAAAPGATTVSIKGRFLDGDGSDSTTNVPVGFTLRGTQTRTRIQLIQGTELKLHVVGEGETVSRSDLKPGAGVEAAVDLEARRIAQALVERVADYYRQEGWLQ